MNTTYPLTYHSPPGGCELETSKVTCVGHIQVSFPVLKVPSRTKLQQCISSLRLTRLRCQNIMLTKRFGIDTNKQDAQTILYFILRTRLGESEHIRNSELALSWLRQRWMSPLEFEVRMEK